MRSKCHEAFSPFSFLPHSLSFSLFPQSFQTEREELHLDQHSLILSTCVCESVKKEIKCVGSLLGRPPFVATPYKKGALCSTTPCTSGGRCS